MATEPAPRRSLRLWPGVAAAVLLLARLALPRLMPEAASYGMLGGVLAALVILLWWLFLSRAPWTERLGAIGLMLVVTAGTWRVLHPSIAGAMMGLLFPIFVVQTIAVALVAWALATRRLADAPRRAWMVAAIIAGCGLWTLVRTEGVTGNSESELRWRWTRTPEEHLLAQEPFVATTAAGAESLEPKSGKQKPQPANPELEVHPATNTAGAASGAPPTARPTPAALPAAGAAEAFWPGFRGTDRDDVVRGVQIQIDWSTSVPVPMWRRPIGPGWSSFAVRGNLLYTQEQRGDHELVSCYALSTASPCGNIATPSASTSRMAAPVRAPRRR